MTVKYRYNGGKSGEFYNGVPARGLTQEERDALPREDQKRVDEGTIYTEVADAPAHPPAKAEDKPAAAKADEKKADEGKK